MSTTLQTTLRALGALLIASTALADEVPDWAPGSVVYAVSVPSFHDSDGDGVGDLRGLLAKLDHLQDGDPATPDDLDVDAIALLSVLEGHTLFGVDPVDFRAVHPAFGTLDDLDALVAAAHDRGLRVILDLPINHTSHLHPWFQAALDDSAGYRDRYVWRDHDPGWTRPYDATVGAWVAAPDSQWVYAMLWNATPDLDHRHPAVRDEIHDVVRFWLDRGVDGLRIQDARYLVEIDGEEGQADTPETFAVLRELRAVAHDRNPDAVILGEAMADLPRMAAYLGADVDAELLPHPIPPGPPAFDAVLDHELFRRLMRALRRGNAASVGDHLTLTAELLPDGVLSAPFLSHANLARLSREVAGDEAALRMAIPVLLTLPGMPVLYYGDELGMAVGEIRGESARRTPYPWTSEEPLHGFTTHEHAWTALAPGADVANVEVQSGDPASVLAITRRWTRIRRGSVALRRGTIEVLSPRAGSSRALVFVRAHADQTVLVAHDVAGRPSSIRVVLPDATDLVPVAVEGHATAVVDGDEVTVTLGPEASGVWRVE